MIFNLTHSQIILRYKKIILVHFDPNVKYNFIQHCFCDLRSHFEALESVLLIFFLGFASKKYDQTDSRAPKCLPRVTKTVMYIVKSCFSQAFIFNLVHK
jgi:hypothetical protein